MSTTHSSEGRLFPPEARVSGVFWRLAGLIRGKSHYYYAYIVEEGLGLVVNSLRMKRTL